MMYTGLHRIWHLNDPDVDARTYRFAIRCKDYYNVNPDLAVNPANGWKNLRF
jgi:hypothetical protein